MGERMGRLKRVILICTAKPSQKKRPILQKTYTLQPHNNSWLRCLAYRVPKILCYRTRPRTVCHMNPFSTPPILPYLRGLCSMHPAPARPSSTSCNSLKAQSLHPRHRQNYRRIWHPVRYPFLHLTPVHCLLHLAAPESIDSRTTGH